MKISKIVLLAVVMSISIAESYYISSYDRSSGNDDGFIVISPPSPLQLVGSFNNGNDMALPSSGTNNSITYHGLRPRHVADTLTINACSNTGFKH